MWLSIRSSAPGGKDEVQRVHLRPLLEGDAPGAVPVELDRDQLAAIDIVLVHQHQDVLQEPLRQTIYGRHR